jgi:hypothetical protein
MYIVAHAGSRVSEIDVYAFGNYYNSSASCLNMVAMLENEECTHCAGSTHVSLKKCCEVLLKL